METSPPVTAKKLCNVVRTVLFMVQNGFSKSKQLTLDVNLLMKRGKIMGKFLNDLMLHYHTALSCRSHDVHMTFVSPIPKEYEFSCSNSPAYKPYIPFHSKRKVHYPCHKRHVHHHRPSTHRHEPPSPSDGDVAYASPLVGPAVRRVRITDSPFPLEDTTESCNVDKAAEEFIERFYNQLRLQKWTAALEANDYYG